MTSATSPSPKLDSTPAKWISASGQICRTMPAMNVPWPASKSSEPAAVVVGLVLVVDHVGVRVASLPRRRAPGQPVDARVLDGGGLSPGRAQAGVEDQELGGRVPARTSGAAANHGGSGAGSDVDWRTDLAVARRRSSAVNIIPPAKKASAPTGHPPDDLAARAPGGWARRRGRRRAERPRASLTGHETPAAARHRPPPAAGCRRARRTKRAARPARPTGRSRSPALGRLPIASRARRERLVVTSDVDDDAVRAQRRAGRRRPRPTRCAGVRTPRPTSRAARGGRRPDSRCSRQHPPLGGAVHHGHDPCAVAVIHGSTLGVNGRRVDFDR